MIAPIAPYVAASDAVESYFGGWSLGSAYPTSTLVPGSITRQVLIDRFTVLPELSLYHAGQQSVIGVFAHEFGHTGQVRRMDALYWPVVGAVTVIRLT